MNDRPGPGVAPERRQAPLIAAGAVLAVIAATLPFADRAGPELAGFVPAWFTVMLACDLGTAALLIGLHRLGGSARLAVLATAFLWSAATTVLTAFVVPGVVHADPTFGGASSLGWLWVVRHVGASSLVVVAMAPWPTAWEGRTVPATRVWASMAAVLALGPGVLALCMAFAPTGLSALADPATGRLDHDVARGGLVFCAIAVATVATAVVWRGARAGLESWALVAVVAWLGEAGFTAMWDAPGSVSFYSARLLGVLAAFVMTGVILRELWRQQRHALAGAVSIEAQMASLVEEQRLREHVAAVVGHDLRVPLVGLLGYQKILAEDQDLDPAVVRRMHERSLKLTQRLSLLTEDLLAATTTDQAELRVDRRVLDLGEQLSECAGGFPTLEVQLRCPAGAQVYADPLRLQQILTNLVSNAHRHGADPVAVEVEADDQQVHIRVSDAGEGVPPTFIPPLAERYGHTPHPRASGPGLGLAVVHELVRRHDGSVRYDVTAPAFIVSLPSREPVEEPPAGPRGARRRRLSTAGG